MGRSYGECGPAIGAAGTTRIRFVTWMLVTRVLSGVMLALGLSLCVPLALSALYADGSWESFLFPAAAMVVVGAGGLRLAGALGRQAGYVSNRDVYLSVTLAWTLAGAVAPSQPTPRHQVHRYDQDSPNQQGRVREEPHGASNTPLLDGWLGTRARSGPDDRRRLLHLLQLVEPEQLVLSIIKAHV
jgi:hypothetical protein